MRVTQTKILRKEAFKYISMIKKKLPRRKISDFYTGGSDRKEDFRPWGSLRLGMLVWSSQRTWSASWRNSNVVLLEIWRVLKSDLLQEAGTTDGGVELKIEGKDPKCRKILSNVSFAMRSSFRKCGFRRLCQNSAEGDGNATVGDTIEDNVRNITESIENVLYSWRFWWRW